VADPDQDRALTALYRAHADFVWRVARALGVPEPLVDDVVHDVFFVVRRRLAALEPGRSPKPWLAGITRNVVMHVHRKLARERTRLERVDPPPPPEIPERVLEVNEAAALVHAFVETLDGRGAGGASAGAGGTSGATGTSKRSKLAIVWRTPSSKTSRCSRVRSVTGCPLPSVTTTSTVTCSTLAGKAGGSGVAGTS